MQNTSPFTAMQRVEIELKAVLQAVDMDTLEADVKQSLMTARRLLVDARLDIRDYELSETRAEQEINAVEARKRLTKLQASILAAGMIFSPADVAQFTAQIEHIRGRII